MVESVFTPSFLGWSLDNLLSNGNTQLQKWVAAIITILGVIILGFAAYKFFKAVTSQQGAGKFALDGGIATLVGGAMLFGGWALIKSIGNGGNQTVNTLGGGAIHWITNGGAIDFVTNSLPLFFH